jgi:16S rRNA (uracil1498-N3)-methyltransferase
MPPRLYVAAPLESGAGLALPPAAVRHVQVLRLQPGDAVALFDGSGGEWAARVAQVGRSSVDVQVGERSVPERELPIAVTLAIGMPANERMDMLLEKATELGVAAIQPLLCERSVLRLAGERAQKKVAHWQAVAVAACEQCGRTRVPRVAPVRRLAEWLAALPDDGAVRLLLSPGGTSPPLLGAARPVVSLSGPEGGLSDDEEAAARARAFVPVSLGPRVLRADTAPLALLALLGLR